MTGGTSRLVDRLAAAGRRIGCRCGRAGKREAVADLFADLLASVRARERAYPSVKRGRSVIAWTSESGSRPRLPVTSPIGPLVTPWSGCQPGADRHRGCPASTRPGPHELASSALGCPAPRPRHRPDAHLLFGAERVARRMAGAAMAEAVDEIGAAVPLRAFGGDVLIGALVEEQRLPLLRRRDGHSTGTAARSSAGVCLTGGRSSGARKAPCCPHRKPV